MAPIVFWPRAVAGAGCLALVGSAALGRHLGRKFQQFVLTVGIAQEDES